MYNNRRKKKTRLKTFLLQSLFLYTTILALSGWQSLQKLWPRSLHPFRRVSAYQVQHKRPTLGTSTPKTVRVSSVKGNSGSRVCSRSFHLSAWRFIHRNTTFKRNLRWILIENSIYIACSACWLCKRTLSLRPRDSRLSPPQLPWKPASGPLFPGPWLHVFSSSTLWVWFLLNKDFVDGLR